MSKKPFDKRLSMKRATLALVIAFALVSILIILSLAFNPKLLSYIFIGTMALVLVVAVSITLIDMTPIMFSQERVSLLDEGEELMEDTKEAESKSYARISSSFLDLP